MSGVRFDIGFKGVKVTREQLRLAENKVLAAVSKSIEIEAWKIMRVSLDQVPWDLGDLSRTHYVRKVRNELAFQMGYTSEYAVYTHDPDPSKPMPNFQRGRKSKYLEDPIKDASRGYSKRIAERAKQLFKGGL